MPTWPAHSSRPTNLRAREACARSMTTMPLSRSAWRQTALLAFLFSQPLLLLVVRGWGSGVLLIGSLLCMVELAAQRPGAPQRDHEWAGNAPLAKWFCASFGAWTLATLVAALLRGHVEWRLLDSRRGLQWRFRYFCTCAEPGTLACGQWATARQQAWC